LGLASVELVGRDWKTGQVWTICHYQFYLDNQFVCFQCDRLLSTGSLFLRLHFRYIRFHWKEYADLSWCECKRIFNRGFLCWIPLTLDFGSWGLCCLYGTDKERNHKGNSCHYEFCAGVYPIGFLYC